MKQTPAVAPEGFAILLLLPVGQISLDQTQRRLLAIQFSVKAMKVRGAAFGLLIRQIQNNSLASCDPPIQIVASAARQSILDSYCVFLMCFHAFVNLEKEIRLLFKMRQLPKLLRHLSGRPDPLRSPCPASQLAGAKPIQAWS